MSRSASTEGVPVTAELAVQASAQHELQRTTVRATTPRRVPAGTAEAASASVYTELARRIKAAGLLRRRRGWYVLRVAVLAGLLAVGAVLLVGLRRTWWQLAVAGYFGVLFTQTAYLAHHGAHRQVFESGPRNETFSRIVGNLGVGLSYGWWMTKHSKHHANPNTLGKDGDIRPGALVFTPRDAADRTGAARWWMARQGWFFFPLLLLAGFDLHRNAILAIIRGEVRRPILEGALITVRLAGFAIVVLLLLGPLLGVVFLLVQVAVFGFTMGSTFAPNHKGMRLIGAGERVDYLRRAGADLPQHHRRLVHPHRDGRAELSDRAPPVPEHAQREPPPRPSPGPRVLRGDRGAVHGDDAAAILGDRGPVPAPGRDPARRPLRLPRRCRVPYRNVLVTHFAITDRRTGTRWR